MAQAHRLYAAFYLEMATGLRRGELLGLRRQDVRNNIIFVRQQLSYSKGKFIFKDLKTKNGKRLIPVSPDVIDVLERHRKVQEAERQFLGEAWPGYDLVFTSEVGTPIHPRNFQRSWDSLKEKAGVSDVRLHDLRHLYASVCVQAGVDPKLLASWLGHARASFTMDVYAQIFEEQRVKNPISIANWLGQDTGLELDKDLEQGEDEDNLN